MEDSYVLLLRRESIALRLSPSIMLARLVKCSGLLDGAAGAFIEPEIVGHLGQAV